MHEFALDTYKKKAEKAKIIPNFVSLTRCLLCRKRSMLTCSYAACFLILTSTYSFRRKGKNLQRETTREKQRSSVFFYSLDYLCLRNHLVNI
jgi:hypothetical protein